MKVIGLLLAAGRGRRFVAASVPTGSGAPDKLLAAHAGGTVIGHALAALQSGCDAVIAVIRPDASDALRSALSAVTCIEAEHADQGMGYSLAAGARACAQAGADAVLVLPGDMPWLNASTVQQVVRALRVGGPATQRARIVVPALPNGRTGHPVGFGADHLPALAQLSGERGARGLLDTQPVLCVTVEDAGILRDVDTPSDLLP